MQIRSSRKSDLSFLPELEKRACAIFGEIGMENDANHDLIPVEDFTETHRNNLLWIAADDQDHPAGFLAARILDGCAFIHEMAVAPEHQRRKVGKQLIETFCTWARHQGFSLVTLSTFKTVPWNAPYYSRLGFEITKGNSLGHEHLDVRSQEIAAGLDENQRVFMKRTL